MRTLYYRPLCFVTSWQQDVCCRRDIFSWLGPKAARIHPSVSCGYFLEASHLGHFFRERSATILHTIRPHTLVWILQRINFRILVAARCLVTGVQEVAHEFESHVEAVGLAVCHQPGKQHSGCQHPCNAILFSSGIIFNKFCVLLRCFVQRFDSVNTHHSQTENRSLFVKCGALLGLVLLLASAWLTQVACQLLIRSAVTSKKRSYEYLGMLPKKSFLESHAPFKFAFKFVNCCQGSKHAWLA